uniref:DNA N(6)-methyladenine demethylase n=1 Tax=Cucumis melo TaxID=3656 RepID=A0A9I9DZ03_CUCME
MNDGGPRYAGRGHPNNRGRSPRSADNFTYRPRHAGGEGSSVAGSSNPGSGAFRGRSSHQMSSRNFRKPVGQKQASSSEQWQWRPLNSRKDASPGAVDLHLQHNSTDDMSNTNKQLLGSIASNSDSNQISNTSEQRLGPIASNSDCIELLSSSAQNVSKSLHSAVERIQIQGPTAVCGNCSDSFPYDNRNGSDVVGQELKVQPTLESCAKDKSSTIKLGESNNVFNSMDSKDKKPSVDLDTFDICPPKTGGVTLNPSLLAMNREKRNEMKRAMDGNNGIVLRPGMVHLKGSISLRDQAKIVKKCRDLGIGAGGFYQPGYREGGKLHLKMMCLGKNWDPDSSTYGDVRPFDDTKPPNLPDEFYQLVEKAIKDSYAIIAKDSTIKNPERVLPWMKPNICIVNFYSQNGRLGLHQDRDESQESLDKGLPVISFSIGDSAEFLFGDRSDVDQAEKVTLESGDILIFGGKSRHVFHGVTAIHSKTAPKALLEATNLRPGRLNLTFRQY